MMRILTTLRNTFRLIVIALRHKWLTTLLKMDIHPSARIAFGAKLDKTNPQGVHIGAESYVASGALVLTHDFVNGVHSDTHIGKRCFVGSNAMIMCGVKIGDEVIVGGGSIVTKDVPSNCIVAGNPARIIRTNIHTGRFGQLIQSKE